MLKQPARSLFMVLLSSQNNARRDKYRLVVPVRSYRGAHYKASMVFLMPQYLPP